jgi:hypothetical protein
VKTVWRKPKLNDLFKIVFVITVIMVMASAAFVIVAPKFGVKTPQPPTFPTLNALDYQGNLTASSSGSTGSTPNNNPFPFSEAKAVTMADADVSSVRTILGFNVFFPLKGMYIVPANGNDYFIVQRAGSPWVTEPIMDSSGNNLGSFFDFSSLDTVIGPTPQEIANDFNGTYSTYTIDNGNNQYMAWMSFYPLPGYSDMISSWNSGHGFMVWMYGYAHSTPTWLDSVTNDLNWFGALVGYFVGFAVYLASVSVAFTTFLTSPVFGAYAEGVGAVIVILVAILFIGALLSFLRGGGTDK